MDTHTYTLDCPHCRSTNTQSARMAVAAGTSTFSGSMVSAGVLGPGAGGVSVGLVGGTSQTNLAAALNPGPRPGWLGLISGLVFGFAIVAFIIAQHLPFGWHEGVELAYLAFFVPFAVLRRRQSRRNWLVAVETFENTRVCHSCGFLWRP